MKKYLKFIFPSIFILSLWFIFNAPTCSPSAVISITAPANGDTVGVNLVTFQASFTNVTEDPPNATVTLNGVKISANGDYNIKGMIVTIENFSLNFLGVSFIAWNLPIGTCQFQISLTTSSGDTVTAVSVFTTDPTIGIYFGDGKDRELTVSAPNTIINPVASITQNAPAGTKVIYVSETSIFRPGDEVLIIQMQGTNAGQYEFRRIESLNETTLTLTAGIAYSYSSTTSPNKANVFKVPNYTSVTVTGTGSITAKPWDGTTGGVVVFRANQTVNLNGGGINVKGKGYRGGSSVGACWSSTYSYSGESYTGLGAQNYKPNGGAGGGTILSNGGGGAGYGANGAPGVVNCSSYSYPGPAGASYGINTLQTLFLGSGGGGGGDGYYNGSWCQTSVDKGFGGVGGGIIKIYAFKLNVNVPISADGGSGGDGWSASSGSWISGGGGGGGSGGSIYISTKDLTTTAKNITALGGKGGNGYSGTYGGCWDDNLPVGGNGSVGRIRIDYQSINGTLYPNAGQGENSIQVSNPPAYGGGLPKGN